MQLDFFSHQDYSGQKILLGLSGGINSMAVLCWLAKAPAEYHPSELHLLYHHFIEHSPDTLDFVLAGVDFAKRSFPSEIIYTQTNNSVLAFFEKDKIIPHPAISPCTKHLKIVPMHRYMQKHGIDVNVVGYVKDELRRIRRMSKKTESRVHDVQDHGVSVKFPIAQFTDEWCFEIVDHYIGWHPAIYDIRDEKGNRVFLHNNCLPCKNMTVEDMELVKIHYPDYFQNAMQTSMKLQRHWGRKADDFYTQFGRLDSTEPCDVCTF